MSGPTPPESTSGWSLPPPGWYPDPSGQPAWRWWDGAAWAPVRPAPRRTPWWLWFLLGVAALMALILAGAGFGFYDEATRQHTFTYTVTGEGSADVTYNLAPGVKRTLRGVELPWTAKVTGSSLFENWVLEAHSPTGARLTCSVALDGTPYSNSGSGSCWESVTSAVSTTTSTASPS